MRTFTIRENKVQSGLNVDMTPYPRVVLGNGGHKKATWIPIGTRDAEKLIVEEKVLHCDLWSKWETVHKRVMDCEVMKTSKGGYLLVSPRVVKDRALVLWKVDSGYRGTALVEGKTATTIAEDQAFHSGRGALGCTSECLCIMEPGQYVEVERSGRNLMETYLKLTYLGEGKFDVSYKKDDEEGVIV